MGSCLRNSRRLASAPLAAIFALCAGCAPDSSFSPPVLPETPEVEAAPSRAPLSAHTSLSGLLEAGEREAVLGRLEEYEKSDTAAVSEIEELARACGTDEELLVAALEKLAELEQAPGLSVEDLAGWMSGEVPEVRLAASRLVLAASTDRKARTLAIVRLRQSRLSWEQKLANRALEGGEYDPSSFFRLLDDEESWQDVLGFFLEPGPWDAELREAMIPFFLEGDEARQRMAMMVLSCLFHRSDPVEGVSWYCDFLEQALDSPNKTISAQAEQTIFALDGGSPQEERLKRKLSARDLASPSLEGAFRMMRTDEDRGCEMMAELLRSGDARTACRILGYFRPRTMFTQRPEKGLRILFQILASDKPGFSPPAVTLLREFAGHPQATTEGRIGIIDGLAALVGDSSRDMLPAALKILAEMKTDWRGFGRREVLAGLVARGLGRADVAVRADAACTWLGSRFEKDSSLMPAIASLIEELSGSGATELRLRAIDLSYRAGCPEIWPSLRLVLLRLLSDPAPEVRADAARVCGPPREEDRELGLGVTETVVGLVRLRDPKLLDRIWCGYVRGFGLPPLFLWHFRDRVAPVLAGWLSDDKPFVRLKACDTLRGLGALPPEVREALEGALGDPEEKVRSAASQALAQAR